MESHAPHSTFSTHHNHTLIPIPNVLSPPPPLYNHQMPDSNSIPLPLPPPGYPTSSNPLSNLAAIQHRVDSLSNILSNSVNGNTPLSKDQSDTISAELSSAIHHIILNGAALLTSTSHTLKMEGDDVEIVELDVMELTSELSHTCEVCGKGFKRDANLRMHMRAHGDKFKTIQSLSKPDNLKLYDNGRKTRFSCPDIGCNRNKKHKDFRPLKSAVCVKNHFKRAHCQKKFPCDRCKKKRFSVLSDLKSHMKHCTVVVEEENTWECSCGRRFSKKDKLFDHMALLEGHIPASGTSNFNVVEEEGGEIWDFGVNEDDKGFKDLGFWSTIEEFLQS